MLYPLNLKSQHFVFVENGAVVHHPFTMPDVLITRTGQRVIDPTKLTTQELITLGVYPVLEVVVSVNHATQTAAPTYTISEDHVLLEYVVTAISLSDLRSAAINCVYQKAANDLNAFANGYSPVEIAMFPLIAADIATYNATGVIGPFMSSVIARGRLAAPELAAMISLKVDAQNLILQKRDDDVALISAMNTALDITPYIVPIARTK